MLNVSIWEFFISVNIERGVCVHFKEPSIEVLVDQDVQAKDLEGSRVLVVGTYETMVSILKVWFKSNNSFLGDITDLLH